MPEPSNRVERTIYQECSLVLESVNASRYSVVSQFEMLALHSPRLGTGAHYLIQSHFLGFNVSGGPPNCLEALFLQGQ